MFADSLRKYVFEDNGRRRRDDRVSLGIALIFSALILALGIRPEVASICGLVLLAICMLCFALYYCNSAPRRTKASKQNANRNASLLYRPVSRRAALVGGLAALLLYALPEAAALAIDRKLRRLAANIPLDQASLLEASNVIDQAAKYKVKFHPGGLKALVSALQATANANPALSGAALIVGSNTASASTVNLEPPKDMEGRLYSSLPEAKGSTFSFFPIATNTGPDNYSMIGMAQRPNTAEMWLVGKTLPSAEYGPAFLITKGLTATLDGYRLKHVIFQDMLLIYHGGPLYLDEVYFFNCKFQFSPTAESWNLISSVVRGGWISYSTSG